MANEQNLKPLGNGERTKSEERRIQSEGGKKSGEARRRKRDMREAAKLLLDMPVSKKQSTMRAILDSLGIPEEDVDYKTAVLSAMLLQAANGNVNAATFLRDTAGENPSIKMREAELRQRKAEFKYQKEQREAEKEAEENRGGFSDLVAEVYEEAWENESNKEGME